MDLNICILVILRYLFFVLALCIHTSYFHGHDAPPQWCPLHTLGPSSTTPLDPLGSLQEGFPISPCISDVGLCGICWWATPQPRDFSIQFVKTRALCMGTAQTIKAEYCLALGQSWGLGVQHTWQGCRVKQESSAYLIEGNKKTPVKLRKNMDTISYGRMGTEWRNISCIPGTTRSVHHSQNTQTANTSISQGLFHFYCYWPSQGLFQFHCYWPAALMTCAYSSSGFLQGFEPLTSATQVSV